MQRPRVSANFAITWDGRITVQGQSGVHFSSPRDKERLVELRAPCDALMVGASTAKSDNMSMGIPREDLQRERVARGHAPQPLRVLVSNSGEISAELQVFQKRISPVVVFTTSAMSAETIRQVSATGAEVRPLRGATVDPAEVLTILAQDFAVRQLHCEGGPRLLRALLERDLVDELYLTACPRVFGGQKTPTLTGVAETFLPRSTQLRLAFLTVEGDECFLRYEVRRPAANALGELPELQ